MTVNNIYLLSKSYRKVTNENDIPDQMCELAQNEKEMKWLIPFIFGSKQLKQERTGNSNFKNKLFLYS